MNEGCIYIALYCVLLYTQSALQLWVWGGGGGSLLHPHLTELHLFSCTSAVVPETRQVMLMSVHPGRGILISVALSRTPLDPSRTAIFMLTLHLTTTLVCMICVCTHVQMACYVQLLRPMRQLVPSWRYRSQNGARVCDVVSHNNIAQIICGLVISIA